MPFVEANIEEENQELEQLINESDEARMASEEFDAKIALKRMLVKLRQEEDMTQTEAACSAGVTQQAVSRMECGSGATVNSLIRYLTRMGYHIEIKKTKKTEKPQRNKHSEMLQQQAD